MSKSNIILIGFRCSGKTTLGRIISKELSMELVDSDDIIERGWGMSIGELVERKGWHYFRSNTSPMNPLDQQKNVAQGNERLLRKCGNLAF